jgi:hypothetical protein
VHGWRAGRFVASGGPDEALEPLRSQLTAALLMQQFDQRPVYRLPADAVVAA